MKTRTIGKATRQSSDVLDERRKRTSTVEAEASGRTGLRAGAAKRRLPQHLATVAPVGVRDWTRDDLYR